MHKEPSIEYIYAIPPVSSVLTLILITLFVGLGNIENKSEISLNDIINQIEDEKILNEFLEIESKNYNK